MQESGLYVGKQVMLDTTSKHRRHHGDKQHA